MNKHKTSEFLLLTYISLAPEAQRDAIDRWTEARAASAPWQRHGRSLYRADDAEMLLEVRRLRSLAELEKVLTSPSTWPTFAAARELLGADVRRQVLGLVESVKPRTSAVPRARGLQLRHIEVPPRVFDEYLAWRERTIFQHVRARAEIESFVAYHSVLSMEPGVMFLSEYSGEKADYLAGFSSPAYRDIVEQAGRRYICGGERALHTTEWSRVSPAERVAS